MKWSRTVFGRDWYDGLAHPAHGNTYRNGSIPARRNRRQDWNSCFNTSSVLEPSHFHHPTPQDTYICCAYSPRCFIIQKVKPSSGQASSDIPDQAESPTSKASNSNQVEQTEDALLSLGLTENGDKNSKSEIISSTMEDIGIVASLPSEASNSTANPSTSMSMSPLTSATTEPQAFSSVPQNQGDVYTNSSPGHVEAVTVGERTIPLPELKAMLRQQLEYYFSRENLATDAYLRSQMDGDQYVPISTIAKFNQIRRLTEDLNLVVEVLRESPYVQVDEAGEKVRPSQRSIVLILREIPESTPMKDLEELFSGENCPKFSRCEFAHNDTWYVLFDTDDDAKKAYCYLREEAKTFNGKPIMARIKASLTSAPYSHSYYKNGVCTSTANETAYNVQQIQQQPQPTQQQQPTQQAHVQYTYASVSNDTYNNQQLCQPFYPPAMLQAWTPSAPTCVDLGAVFSMNGLSPQAAYRPVNNATKASYPTRERTIKQFNPAQSYLSRSDQNNRYFGRSAHIPRQQPQQQQPFHNLINAAAAAANSCFDYGPYAAASSLRNLHTFGIDMNTFAAPSFCFRRLQSHTTSYGPQSRHTPLLLPTARNQIGVGAINTQDQSYLPVASTMIPFHKDTIVTGTSVASVSRQNTDMQNKDSWSSNQKQRNKKWPRENGTTATSKPFPESTNGSIYNKSLNGADTKPESPKFDLQTASFPPLPGCLDNDVLEVDVPDNTRLSDIVKGTAKPATRDNKTQTSESTLSLNAVMKDTSTLTIEETAAGSSDGAFIPATASSMLVGLASPVDMSADLSSNKSIDWVDETYISDTSKDETLLSSNSINSTTQTPNSGTGYSLASNSLTSGISPVSLSSSSPSSTVVQSCNQISVTEQQDSSANVPSETVVTVEKQTVQSKTMPKSKQPETSNKNSKPCDLSSPKSKTPDCIGKIKTEIPNKEKLPPPVPKPHRVPSLPVTNSKLSESSLVKDKADSVLSSSSSSDNVLRNSDSFSPKDKPLHPIKGRSFDLPKVKGHDVEQSLLSINGHVDNESVSSEDEKPFRKPTYSEVAIRAKDKVEKLAQEIKEKERQEAMIRHRQQENIAQGGPFREFNRRVDRPGPREWKERRKPARTVSLPSPGQ